MLGTQCILSHITKLHRGTHAKKKKKIFFSITALYPRKTDFQAHFQAFACKIEPACRQSYQNISETCLRVHCFYETMYVPISKHSRTLRMTTMVTDSVTISTTSQSFRLRNPKRNSWQSFSWRGQIPFYEASRNGRKPLNPPLSSNSRSNQALPAATRRKTVAPITFGNASSTQ